MDTLLQPSQSQTVDTPVKLISPSRTRTFLECPKKYDYIYNQELTPVGPQKRHFNKGNYFHELCHVYYNYVKAGATPGSEYIQSLILDRMKKNFTTDTDPALISVFGIITKMMTRYVLEHSKRIDDGMKVINVEQQIIYPMADYAMFGYVDLLYRDREGRLHIRDHKTGERAQTKLDAQFSNQLLFYAAIIYKSTGEVPIGELSYINTKEYATKKPTYEESFVLSRVTYTAKELDIYFAEICMVIEDMLSSRAVPSYGQHCAWCAYQTPCYLSRKGIDPSPIINTHFVRVPRDSQRRHAKFTSTTESDTVGNGTD